MGFIKKYLNFIPFVDLYTFINSDSIKVKDLFFLLKKISI